MSTDRHLVRVVWVETLHHKDGREGGQLLAAASVQFSEVDPVLCDDPIDLVLWGWSPGEQDGSGADGSDIDFFWWTRWSCAIKEAEFPGLPWIYGAHNELYYYT